MTQIKKMVTLQTVTRLKVLKMLEVSELYYGDYLMQQAFAYLEEHMGGNIMCKTLSETAMFWGWWRNHWHSIDMLFVDEARRMTPAERMQYYEIVHSLKNFEFTPPTTVLRDAFLKINYQPLIIHTL
jgi:phage terminase large subunit GpA-like protein